MLKCIMEKWRRYLKRTLQFPWGMEINQLSYKVSLEKVHKGSTVVRNALIRLLGPSEREVLYPSHSLLGVSILTLKQGQSLVLHSNC